MEYNEKQIAIINAATQLFGEKGFEGTSVRDIAHAAEVNVAMISYYFGSKEKLMEAIFEKRASATKLKIDTLLNNKDLSPLNKVYSLIEDYVDKFINERQFHLIMMREQMFFTSCAVSDMIFELKKRNLESVKKIIGEGQKTGEFKKNIDIPLMMTTMIGTASQMMSSLDFYKKMNNMEDMPEEEVLKHVRKKMITHLKGLFKAFLTNQ